MKNVHKISQDIINKVKISVFVFETLMNIIIQEKLLKRKIQTEEAILNNYKEISIESEDGPDYHTIIPLLGEKVLGKILFVTKEELKVLDNWEDQYERKLVILDGNKNAWIYLLKKDKMKDKGKNLDVTLTDDDWLLINKWL